MPFNPKPKTQKLKQNLKPQNPHTHPTGGRRASWTIDREFTPLLIDTAATGIPSPNSHRSGAINGPGSSRKHSGRAPCLRRRQTRRKPKRGSPEGVSCYCHTCSYDSEFSAATASCSSSVHIIAVHMPQPQPATRNPLPKAFRYS